MAHKHSVYDTDLHFAIDPVTRGITNQSGKIALMQGDHNSERFTFELPKTIEQHDMSLCDRIEIHYINTSSNKTDSNEDVYTVDDVQASPDDEEVLIFSWLVSGAATKYAGSLSFRIRFLCIDEDGKYTYKWHTSIFKAIAISDGIDNLETIEEKNSDFLSQLEARFQALEEDVDSGGGTVTNEQIASAVENYMLENPVVGEKGENGSDGVGIASTDVVTSAVDSGTNAITFNLTNGKSTTFTVNNGSKGSQGEDGQDGYSPIATVTQTESGAVIEITDKNGTTTATVLNGEGDLSAELTNALKTYFTNMQTLLSQIAYTTDEHIGNTLIQNAKDIVTALNSESIEPDTDISQNGNILTILGGVTVTQTGSILAIV